MGDGFDEAVSAEDSDESLHAIRELREPNVHLAEVRLNTSQQGDAEGADVAGPGVHVVQHDQMWSLEVPPDPCELVRHVEGCPILGQDPSGYQAPEDAHLLLGERLHSGVHRHSEQIDELGVGQDRLYEQSGVEVGFLGGVGQQSLGLPGSPCHDRPRHRDLCGRRRRRRGHRITTGGEGSEVPAAGRSDGRGEDLERGAAVVVPFVRHGD